MENQKSLREQIIDFKNGKFDATDVNTQCDAGWYDWFCKDSALPAKTQYLYKKVLKIIDSKKINMDTMYVFFKNNCPMSGGLYDDFRICDLESGNVIYTITPNLKTVTRFGSAGRGYKQTSCSAEVWGRENDFEGPLVDGSWKDVKDFFLK